MTLFKYTFDQWEFEKGKKFGAALRGLCCGRVRRCDSVDSVEEDWNLIIQMLNNITNDLDLLLSEFCDPLDPGEPPPIKNKPMRTK
ncbi:hypothetical protein MAR_000505, partial [Mya arenaria]